MFASYIYNSIYTASLDMQEELLAAKVETARDTTSPSRQLALRAAGIPAKANRVTFTVTSVHWAPAVLLGCALQEHPSLGFGLVHAVFAGLMRAGDGQPHSGPAAASIAEEFQLVSWQSAAIPEELAATSSAQCSFTATRSFIVTPLTSRL